MRRNLLHDPRAGARGKPADVPWQVPRTWCFFDPATRLGRTYHGRLRLLLALAGEINNARILDAGCGDGKLSAACRQNGAVVFGIDTNESAIAFAKVFVPEGIFQVGTVTGMPYEDNSFDVVFCIETFEHIPPSIAHIAVAEFFRVLKRGGRLLLSVPSVRLPLRLRPRHYRHFTPAMLSEIFCPPFSAKYFCGQEKRTLFTECCSRLVENSFLKIHPLARFVNTRIFPRFWNAASLDTAAHVIAVFGKE